MNLSSSLGMDILMKGCMAVVQEYDNSLTDGATRFGRNIATCTIEGQSKVPRRHKHRQNSKDLFNGVNMIKAPRPYIRSRLGATPQRSALNLVKGVSVEKQVAIVLHKLAIRTDYVAMSDHCFRNISVRHPGSAKDRCVLEDSNIYKYIHSVLSPRNSHSLNERKIHENRRSSYWRNEMRCEVT
ncbi:hypothetical protein KM043_005745 [Ampulex compressa]|nr:hypothetical protein KM043_005745 [Ampulex compressa]